VCRGSFEISRIEDLLREYDGRRGNALPRFKGEKLFRNESFSGNPSPLIQNTQDFGRLFQTINI
jgi:hypothetical protein